MNDELRQRTEELNSVNSLIESILTSLHAGVIVMDKDLRVMIWNHKSEDLWGLREDEVQGKNFLNLDIGLPVEQLKRSIRECLQGASDQTELILSAHNRRGKEIQCKVITTPLLDQQEEIRGVITTIEDDGLGLIDK